MKRPVTTDEIALAHDYFVQMGGAERVVANFHRFWPQAPIYTSVVKHEGLLPELADADFRTNWTKRLPGVLRDFRRYFALYPFAFLGQRPVRAKVLLISASTFAKCLRAAPGTVTICYCHAPTRFLWENSGYLLDGIRSRVLRGIVKATLPVLRRIDHAAAQRMDVMVANSEYVRTKIKQAYGRDSVVIYPPVDVSGLKAIATHAGYYLIVSRLVRYKGVDIAIEACKRLQRKLIIVGEGPDRSRLEELARGGEIHFAGRVSELELRQSLLGCRAFIFPGLEDFGIAPVEAQGWGKPVVAFGQGGALETVIPGETGVFFEAQTADSLSDALRAFESRNWNAERIRHNALRFSADRFESEMRALVGRHLDGAGFAAAGSVSPTQ